MEFLAIPASWGSFPLPLYQSYRGTLEYSGGDSGLLQRVDYKRHLSGFLGGGAVYLYTVGSQILCCKLPCREIMWKKTSLP